MKYRLLVIVSTLLTFECYAQIAFEKAYFITNDDQRVECFIKNVDWNNNPLEFEYRLDENTEAAIESIENVKEFGVYDFSKYVRAQVDIDLSDKSISEITTSRAPVFETKELFLKVLVDGHLSLYHYRNKRIERFFYRNGSSDIEQLVFKAYKAANGSIAENKYYQQQILASNINCDQIKAEDVQRLNYQVRDLVKIFVQSNQCGSTEVINFREKQSKNSFSLSIRPGLNLSSVEYTFVPSNLDPIQQTKTNQIGLRLGIEFEFTLPFNKNKWSIIGEPTFQYFNREVERSFLRKEDVNYTSIEVPLGLRYYIFLNESSKLFVNGAGIYDIDFNAKIGEFTEIRTGYNLAFGAGYKHNNTYSLEVRYQTPRALASTLQSFTDYKKLEVIFGYAIF